MGCFFVFSLGTSVCFTTVDVMFIYFFFVKPQNAVSQLA